LAKQYDVLEAEIIALEASQSRRQVEEQLFVNTVNIIVQSATLMGICRKPGFEQRRDNIVLTLVSTRM